MNPVVPRVTVGVPVKNGGATLRRALESVIGQTYPDLAIIISDNCSTDDTAAIALEFAERDPRIRYVNQSQSLTAIRNFRYLVDQAQSEFFMWAAHDDFRSDNYVEALVKGFDAHPSAVLSYGDIVQFSDDDADPASVAKLSLDFPWEGLSHYRRLKEALPSKCGVIYGLFRTAYLREYSWIEPDYGPDIPLLLYARARAEFVHAPSAILYEWIYKGGIKPPQERALYEANRKMRSFRLARLAWCCADAVAEAARVTGAPPKRTQTLLFTYFLLKKNWTKIWLFRRMPEPITRLWIRHRAGGGDRHTAGTAARK